MNAWSFFLPPGPVFAVTGITRGTAAAGTLLRSRPLVVISSARRWGTTSSAAAASSLCTRPSSSLPSLRPRAAATAAEERRRIATAIADHHQFHHHAAATTRICGWRWLPSRSFSSRPILARVIIASRTDTRHLSSSPQHDSSQPQQQQQQQPHPSSESRLPLPTGPNEPKLKVIYSAAEDKVRRGPPPDPPKGSWRHYRNWLFRITGPHYDEKTPWTWFKWHSWGAFRVFIFFSFTLFNLLAFGFGCVTWYIERQDPTPKVFTEWARTSIHIIHWYTEWNIDLPLAGVWAEELLQTLEKQMEEFGGWEECTIVWKRAYVDTCFKLAKLFMSIAKDEDAYALYRRILAMGPEAVDASRRSQASLGMADCAVSLDRPSDEVDGLMHQAVRYALEAVPADQRPKLDITKPVLPEPNKNVVPPSSEMLGAVQALGIRYSRQGKPSDSLPIFLSLLRTLQALPENQRDNCRESTIMAYLGEVLWAIGKQADGLAWTKKAMEEAEKGLAQRDTCRTCAIYAVANAITMTEEMGAGLKGKLQDGMQKELSALKSRQDWLDKLPHKGAAI
ncbi:hypothetical protein AA313_de0208319 [Arthrobotrys entomopaga]|nr:hypothetical protein AA313_de0208319 [Arthrobotrys entomopaga]